MLSLPDNTRTFLIDKLETGTYRLSQTIDTRLPITIPILNKMLLAIPVFLNSYYEQCIIKAMFLFAFSTFARIGELVAVRDIPQEHILQLSDVSLTSVQGEIKEAVVSFRKFKHNIKEGAEVVRFTDENTNSSEPAIKCLVKNLSYNLDPNYQGHYFAWPLVNRSLDHILMRSFTNVLISVSWVVPNIRVTAFA